MESNLKRAEARLLRRLTSLPIDGGSIRVDSGEAALGRSNYCACDVRRGVHIS